MLLSDTEVRTPEPPGRKIDFRFIAGALLLLCAGTFTWKTIDELSARRMLRMELAEISHVRYGLLNADRWVAIVLPIVDAQVDALDLKAANRASLRPTVEKALYRLLDQIKDQMGKSTPAAGGGGFLGGGNALIANMMAQALRPHVPEYADVVLAELANPENKQAFKNYIKSVLADGAKGTFGSVDKKWYEYILKKHGCADAGGCQPQIGGKIREIEARVGYYYPAVLASSALAFLLMLTGGSALRRSGVVLLLLFCLVLLAGGVLTPTIEVEAKISRLGLSLMGTPVVFQDQVLYFQSKSVLEVFQTLIDTGKADMWVVGVLVLMFSVVFPTLKVFSLAYCLFRPASLRGNRVVRFLALDSAKWSMADVMALAIFMSVVAFNGLIMNSLAGVQGSGELAIPTDSSKVLPGYYLFIGFCLSGLFLSMKLERGIRSAPAVAAQD